MDEAIDKIGGFGPYQLYLSISVILGFNSLGTFLYNMHFNQKMPNYECFQHEKWQNCAPETFCNTEIQFRVDEQDPYFIRNWVQQLDLHCQSKAQIGIIGSAYFVGYIISCAIFPRFINIYGRKPFLNFYLISVLASAVCVTQARSIQEMQLIYLITGISTSLKSSSLLNLLLESIPQRNKAIIGSISLLASGALGLLNTFYLKYVNNDNLDFHYFGIAITMYCIISLNWVNIAESPRYLLSKGEYQQARDSLTIIQNFNKKWTKIDDFKINQTQFQEEIENPENQKKEGLLNFDAKTKQNLYVMIGIWSITTFNFYLLSYQQKYLKGNIFINSVIMNTTQVSAAIYGGVLYQNLGIQKTIIYSFTIAMLGAVGMFFGNDFVIPFCIIAAKFGCSSMFCVVYIANSDIFSPDVSSAIFGICNVCARIVTIGAPMVAELKEPVPLYIFTILCGIGIIIPRKLVLDAKIKQD